jgi:Peptidase family M13
MAQLTAPSEDRRDAYRMYNSLSVRQLQKWTDSVHRSNGKRSVMQWDQLLKYVFHEAKVSISSGERMMVREMEYLLKLEVLLQKTPPRLLGNNLYILFYASDFV